MTFEASLVELKDGRQLQRDGWNGKGMWVETRREENPDSMDMTLPYLCLNIPDHIQGTTQRVPWLPSQTDIFAEDWHILEIQA